MIRFSSFKYLVKQGWHSMLANRLMTLASMGVLVACLMITGVAVLLSLNVNNFVEMLSSRNEVEFFISDDTSSETAEGLRAQVEASENVSECLYISKAQAVEEMVGYLGSDGDVLQNYRGEGNDTNPLPASLRVTISNLETLDATVSSVLSLGNGIITDYTAPSDLSAILVALRQGVSYVGWGLVAILGVVSIVVISNTIRLTVFARRKEINIMKFVGATNGFIRLPFFIEGITVGALSGLIATGIVCGGYYAVLQSMGQPTVALMWEFTRCMLPLQSIWPWLLSGFVGFGALLGGLGCATSIKKHLKV